MGGERFETGSLLHYIKKLLVLKKIDLKFLIPLLVYPMNN